MKNKDKAERSNAICKPIIWNHLKVFRSTVHKVLSDTISKEGKGRFTK